MRRGAAIGQPGIGGQHVIGLGHGKRGVVDDREIGRGACEMLDVALPIQVIVAAAYLRAATGRSRSRVYHRS
jgi:hypothetical protein